MGSFSVVDELSIPASDTIAIDCEWTPDGRLALIQVHDGTSCQILPVLLSAIPKERHIEALEVLFHTKCVLGFNFHSDLKTIADYAGRYLLPKNLVDIKILFRLSHPGHKASLNDVCNYYGYPIDKTLQASDWSGELTQDQLEYAANDTAVLHKLYAELIDISLSRYARLENTNVSTCGYITWCGIRVKDPRALLAEHIAEIDKVPPPGGINTSSPKQVKAYLASCGVHVSSTSVEHLAKVLSGTVSPNVCKDIKTILTRRRLLKAVQFLEQIRDYRCSDGRIHSVFQPLVISASGRTSSSRPNLQNPPRSTLRSLFVGPFYYFDLSNIHARIAAELSGDDKLVNAFNLGLDIHSITGSHIGHIFQLDHRYSTPEAFAANKSLPDVARVRIIAKAVFYGLLNGQGAEGLLLTLAKGNVTGSNDAHVSIDMAHRIVDEIRNLYPRLTSYTRWAQQQRQIRYRDGYTLNTESLSPTERIAHIWLHYEAVIMKYILNSVVSEYCNKVEINMYMHDAAMFTVPETIKESFCCYVEAQYHRVMTWMFRRVLVPPLQLKLVESMPI